MLQLSQYRVAQKFKKLLRCFCDARPYRPVFLQLLDLLTHRVFLKIIPRDYYEFRFYDPVLSWAEKKRYICPGGSTYWPYENNPLKYTTTLSNKYLQKHMLMGFGLPTPPLLHSVGTSLELRDKASFATAIKNLTGDFLLKPVCGAQGSRILVVRQKDGGYYSAGEKVTIDFLWSHVAGDLKRGFLVERRMYNIEYLRALSPNSLNTYRVTMIKSSDGKWHVANVALKCGAGASEVDNYSAGGVWMSVNKSGETYAADGAVDGKHPDTGLSVIGIKIVDFDGLLELALRASEKFGYMGTIGWDIAHTDQGFVIIEGNTLWGPIAEPMISDEMLEGLTAHEELFTSWKAGGMHPSMSV